MKKRLCLLLSMLLVLLTLAGCGHLKEDEIFEAMAAANGNQALLDAHGRYAVEHLYINADGSTSPSYVYLDADTYYTQEDDYWLLDCQGQVAETDLEHNRVVRRFYVDAAYEQELAQRLISGFTYSQKHEKMISHEMQDDLLVVTSVLKQKEFVQSYGSVFGFAPRQIKSLGRRYYVDPATFEIQFAEHYFILKDHTEHVFLQSTAVFEPVPLEIDTEQLAPYFEGPSRQLKVIVDPGSPAEHQMLFSCPKGVAELLVLPRGYDTMVYSNAACTTPHVTVGAFQDDATIYVQSKG